jgi:penicillin-binding protein 1A
MNGDWVFEEFAKEGSISSLGVSSESSTKPATPAPVSDERSKILDLFRN